MKNWQQELSEVLGRAAALGAEHDVDLDAFMRGAWQAYVDARPGMREHLEEAALRGQLELLRQSGRIGQA